MHITSLVKIYLSYRPEMKMRTGNGQITVKIWRNLPIRIPKQISTISMYTPSLVKIHWYLLKLSSGNENTDLSRADNSVKTWRNLPISNSLPYFYNIDAHTEFGEAPSTFPRVIIWKRKYGRMEWRTTDGRTHGQPMWYYNTPPLSYGWL